MTAHKLLQIFLVLFGVTFCLVYPLALIWHSGWAWHEGPPASSDYFMMIVAVYAVLGLFLIRAAANPAANRSLIWFTFWSSLAHALVMAAQALGDRMQMGHMLGDIPALLLVAIALGAFNAADTRTAAPLQARTA